MFCRFCGKELPEESESCPHCGQDQYIKREDEGIENVSMTTIDKVISIISFVMSAFLVLSPFLKLYHMNVSGTDVYFSYTDIFNTTTKIGEVNLWKYDDTLPICAFFYACAIIFLLGGIVFFVKIKNIFLLKFSASASAVCSTIANALGCQILRALDPKINPKLWTSVTETAMPVTNIWYALICVSIIVFSIYLIEDILKKIHD